VGVGVCSMAIGEFVSVSAPSPSATRRRAFPAPSRRPLLAAGFITNYRLRIGVVVFAVASAGEGAGGEGADRRIDGRP
jgi:hypothetical protein